MSYLERLLVIQALRLGRNLKAILRRVQNSLDVLDQAILLLLNLGILVTRLLNQQLDVAELAEVEIPLAFQPLYRLFQCGVLLR